MRLESLSASESESRVSDRVRVRVSISVSRVSLRVSVFSVSVSACVSEQEGQTVQGQGRDRCEAVSHPAVTCIKPVCQSQILSAASREADNARRLWQRSGHKPDVVAYSSLIRACSAGGQSEKALEVWAPPFSIHRCWCG